jgi:hypothetical protein
VGFRRAGGAAPLPAVRGVAAAEAFKIKSRTPVRRGRKNYAENAKETEIILIFFASSANPLRPLRTGVRI